MRSTEQTESPEHGADLDKKIKQLDAIEISKARTAHEDWWKEFWNRSWINVTGMPDTEKVTQGYAMQRFMTACAGRGAQPIKFNETLFTVGHICRRARFLLRQTMIPITGHGAHVFGNQDTRLIYYPLIAAGDYDLLKPWFNMYLNALPLEKDRTRLYFHHDGASLPETMLSGVCRT